MDSMVKKSIIFTIQCRTNSARLPGKLFFNFFNASIIKRVIRIASACIKRDNIVILSGDQKKNYLLKNIAKKNGIKIFFGDENNVHQRYKTFLKKNKCDYVFRMTADNYLMQPKIIKKMMKDIIKYDYDYSYVYPLSHYAGEFIKTKIFFTKGKISKKAKEHVTWDFRKNKKLNIKKYKKNFCNINHNNSITLDNLNDLVLMKKIENSNKKLKKLDCIGEIKKIKFSE